MSRWKTKESRTVAESTLFTLQEDIVEMPDGTERTYTMLDLPDFAGVLPILNDKIVMVRNYRYPLDERVLEIPAGFIDEGEEPLETAERELEEETGYLLEDPVQLCEYHTIANLNKQKAYLFMGDAEEGGSKNRDEGEDMETVMIPIEKVYEMLDKGSLSHPHTMLALFYAGDKLI